MQGFVCLFNQIHQICLFLSLERSFKRTFLQTFFQTLIPLIQTAVHSSLLLFKYSNVLLQKKSPSGHRVKTAAGKRIAAQNSPCSHGASFYSSVFFHCFQAILGTGRNIGTSCALERRQIFLIHSDRSDHCFFHHFHIKRPAFLTSCISAYSILK